MLHIVLKIGYVLQLNYREYTCMLYIVYYFYYCNKTSSN